ncbi:cytochrome c oxidase subunit VIII KNAG_0B06140 [Huiozyma naganishii CBS 8797]|uniref:Cytochrome c oxidase subunit 8, mitochondrial n=1 Tax=Huiozyma naganishii (strain ATCC MYA-139 / BCRC 22969 / CBS 8797 / KCTC 17520 / NBRC 10181 / NCYC 3082 / Yp74L-3) TaxID=1071383 RepID=J7S430_HUIN7|nr:hypothetical protein KNAG_0B06140 [Kazachstania naganishii CBS 8797]CCK69044.1 hypothetical protein KNAG_0B06140 [Kazachstania naganishii CBS 8797]
MIAQQIVRTSGRRMFASSARNAAHFKEGVYSNLPFKIHDRKIPYGVVHFGFFAVGFAVPFIACFVQLKKSGNI